MPDVPSLSTPRLTLVLLDMGHADSLFEIFRLCMRRTPRLTGRLRRICRCFWTLVFLG